MEYHVTYALGHCGLNRIGFDIKHVQMINGREYAFHIDTEEGKIGMCMLVDNLRISWFRARVFVEDFIEYCETFDCAPVIEEDIEQLARRIIKCRNVVLWCEPR